MATASLYFPSSGFDYVLNSGTYQFKFYYDNASTVNSDSNCEIIKIGNIKYYIGADFASNTYKYSYLDIEIENISDYFESSAFTNGESKMFAEIIRNGSLYFSGFIPFSAIEKMDFYLDGGSLTYRRIKIRIYDALYYYTENMSTLSDVSYSDGDTLKSLFDTIIGGVHSGTITYDSTTMISEAIAGNDYNFQDLIISDTTAATYLVRDFIAYCATKLGMCIYNYNGIYYVMARSAGTTVSITQANVIDCKKIKLENYYKYVKVTATKDWTNATNSELGDYDNEKEYGDGDAEEANQLIVTDEKKFLTKLGIDWGGSTATPSSQETPDSYGTGLTDPPTTYINWSDTYCEDDEIETGMLLEYGAHPSYLWLPIVLVPDADSIYVPFGYYNGNDCNVLRSNTNNGATYVTMIYKILKLTEWLAGHLYAVYVSPGFKDRFDLKYNGITAVSLLYARISIFGENRYIDEFTLDIEKNTTHILTI